MEFTNKYAVLEYWSIEDYKFCKSLKYSKFLKGKIGSPILSQGKD